MTTRKRDTSRVANPFLKFVLGNSCLIQIGIGFFLDGQVIEANVMSSASKGSSQ
jgi:hypothetical protein